MDREESREKEAIRKAMRLLVSRDRSEQELRDRLAREGYDPESAEAAIEYVKSYGYVNDRRYAENYVMSAGSRKSRAALRSFLQDKGIAGEEIENALEELPGDETELIGQLLVKKAGQPHKMEEKELRRALGCLARKGFSSGDIWKVIREYQEGFNFLN